MSAPPDEAALHALMCRGLEGDAKAHAALLSAAAILLRSYINRRLGGAASHTEDLVQETLISIHTRRATWDRQRPLLPWLYAIARYRMIDFFRAMGIRKTVPLDGIEEPGIVPEAYASDAARDLSHLLSALPARQRELIRLIKIEGLSVEEAASRMGMSGTAAKVSVHRGIRAMQHAASRETGEGAP